MVPKFFIANNLELKKLAVAPTYAHLFNHVLYTQIIFNMPYKK